MSFIRVAYVICDGCGSNATVDNADTGSTASDQRVELRRDYGWKVGLAGGRDLCDAYAEEAP